MISKEKAVSALTQVLDAAQKAGVDLVEVSVSSGDSHDDLRILVQGTSDGVTVLTRASAVVLVVMAGATDYEVSGVYGGPSRPMQTVSALAAGVRVECITLAEAGEQA